MNVASASSRAGRLALVAVRKDTMTLDTLEELAGERGARVHVSIFLPTHPSDTEGRQDALRLKNLLREAEEALIRRGHRRRSVEAILTSARGWINDREFWKHQGRGLAVFITEHETREYRLSVDVEERCFVGERFHVAPLVSQATGDGRFRILALSQNRVRLYEATRDDIEERVLSEVPRDIRDALGRELRRDTLQWHTRTPPTVGNWRPRDAMFHGQGAGEDDVDPEQRQFVRVVDRALIEELDDQSPPMVVAAVPKLAALYHQISHYPRLVEGWVHGNPDEMDAKELQRRAWSLAESWFVAEGEQALALFPQMEDAGRASTDLTEILRAAAQGRVGTLMIAKGVHPFGEVDEDTLQVDLHENPSPHDEDLVERAVVSSLEQGAAVHVHAPEQMPHGAPVAALYRY
jgi:hypothetical protein